MDRPVVNDPISTQILDDMEAGKISPIEAKMQIPDHEKASVIEYILCWEETAVCRE